MSGSLSIALNENNDIYIGEDGNLAFVSDEAAVDQDCRCVMKAQLGEMIFNIAAGLPTFDDVWQSQNFIKWEGVARTTLANVNGVVRVVTFNIVVNGDNFTYTAQIQTIYSATLLTITDTIGPTL